MQHVYQRMAELTTIKKWRKLTHDEQEEMNLCLEANANHIWNKIKLENYSLLASMTNDYEWLHEVCGELEKFEAKPAAKTDPSAKTDPEGPSAT